MQLKSLIASVIVGATISTANAALLIDWSPDTVASDVTCCLAQPPLYLQQFHLFLPTELTGFVYYNENNSHNPSPGDHVYLYLYRGPFVANQLAEQVASIDGIVVDNHFEGASASNYGDYYGLTGIFSQFAPIALDAGDYLLAYVSVTGFALLHGTSAPFDTQLPQLDNAYMRLSGSPPIGTMAMRLYGDAVTVPEPGTLALLAGTLVLLASACRYRQARTKQGT